MRVLFITHWFPSKNNGSNGIFIKNHLESIRRVNLQVDALVIRVEKGKGILKRSFTEGKDYNELVIRSIFWKVIYMFYPIQRVLIWNALKGKVVYSDYSLIHANVGHPNGVIGAYLAKKFECPFVISEHHSAVKRLCNHPVTGRSMIRMYSKAEVIMPVSIHLENELLSVLRKWKKFHVVPNVIDSDVFHFIEEHTPKKESAMTFVAIGTWTDGKSCYKDPKMLVGALNAVAGEMDRDIELIHIGNCTIVDELLELITRKNFRIRFEGVKLPIEVNEYLNASDCFIHATKQETFCVVGVEAQKSGIPVIISNISPIPQVINGYGASFVNNNIEEWIGAIHSFSKSVFDRKRISEEMKDRYTMIEIGNMFKSIYLESEKSE